jgi:hypothetical protein
VCACRKQPSADGSWSHTCGTGATLLLVGLTYNFDGTNQYSSVEYAGSAMSLVGTIPADNQTAGGVVVCSLENPAEGANNVTWDYAEPGNPACGGSISLTGGGSLGTR